MALWHNKPYILHVIITKEQFLHQRTKQMAYPALHAYPSFHYYLRDHLGSNRMVVGSDGTVEQTNQCYPYGGPWGDVSTYFKDSNFAISPAAVNSSVFRFLYTKVANSYGMFNATQGIGKSPYHLRTTVLPYSLIKIIMDTSLKNWRE